MVVKGTAGRGRQSMCCVDCQAALNICVAHFSSSHPLPSILLFSLFVNNKATKVERKELN